MLNDVLGRIAPSQRDAFRRNYRALTQLPGAPTDLQQFLDDYLERVVQLYAAAAGAIWFRMPETETLSLKSSMNFERLGLHDELHDGHTALLQYGLRRTRSFLVSPFSAPESLAPVSNPTDSYIVIGPVDNSGERLGLVQLFLGPTPARGQTADVRERYALWLDHLLIYLRQGIELRYLGSSAPLQPALVNLEATRSEIDAFKDAIRRSLEVTLNNYAGMSFGSLRNNQAFTRAVHELLENYGLRIACPECGAPAILRCQPAGNAKTGAFLYDHYLESGRTFHGGPTAFPAVRVVPKPPRRRANEI